MFGRPGQKSRDAICNEENAKHENGIVEAGPVP